MMRVGPAKFMQECTCSSGKAWSEARPVDQDVGKGRLSLRGVAFMTALVVLTVLAVLESTLPSFCLSYKIHHNVAVLTVWAVSAVMAVSVMTATPLKLNPPFPSS